MLVYSRGKLASWLECHNGYVQGLGAHCQASPKLPTNLQDGQVSRVALISPGSIQQHAHYGRFRDYSVRATGNAADDLYGFQAANIQATFQLVRMTLFSVDTNHDVHQKCAVAEELLASLHSICPRFLTSISAPLVYHLAGVGHILATIMEGSLTEESYQRVRSSLVSMADLLEGLESGLQPTAGASKGLRAQVEKIDQYMQTQRSSSAYGPQMPNHSPMAATYSPEQRSAYQQQQQQQPPLGHAINGYPLPTGSDQFQGPQGAAGPWSWPPFESQTDSSHPANNTRGFGGGATGP
jgi:hypothetical protein